MTTRYFLFPARTPVTNCCATIRLNSHAKYVNLSEVAKTRLPQQSESEDGTKKKQNPTSIKFEKKEKHTYVVIFSSITVGIVAD